MNNKTRRVICGKCRSRTIRGGDDSQPCYLCGAVTESLELTNDRWDGKTCPICKGLVFDGKCPDCSELCFHKRMSQAPESDPNEPEAEQVLGVKETFLEPVGDALAALIPEWAVDDSKGCNCKSWKLKMNRWGVDGCRAREDVIVQHLVGQSKHLKGVLSYLPDSTYEVAARWLLNRAIKKAQKK